MANLKLRREIAIEAARLIYGRQESEYYRAKMKAARRICQGWIAPAELPTNREIRDEILAFARIHEGPLRADSATDLTLEDALGAAEHDLDRFGVYRMLLVPLEGVKQNPQHHPEGDALYHSLQVFDLARAELPYDEEFQLAALLHDVGKAIDPKDHVAAGLEALQGAITQRTAWLIEHHSDAGAITDGKLGARARHRLEANENFEELMLLSACDRRGREKGVEVPELEAALESLRELARMCDE